MLEAENEHGVLLEQQTEISGRLVSRIMVAPPGVIILGCLHRDPHVAVCIGDIDVYDGQRIKRIRGYEVMDCPGGTRRLGYTLSQVTWVTIHVTPPGIDRGSTEAEIENALLVDPERLQSRRLGKLSKD